MPTWWGRRRTTVGGPRVADSGQRTVEGASDGGEVGRTSDRHGETDTVTVCCWNAAVFIRGALAGGAEKPSCRVKRRSPL